MSMPLSAEELTEVSRRSFAIVCPYVSRIACLTEDPDGVVRSGADVPDCTKCQESTIPSMYAVCTFLHVKATWGLWTAYFVTTSRIREYSSDEPLKAESRVGVL